MLNPAGLYPHSADGSRGPPPHLMLRRSGSGGYDDAPFNFGNQQLFQGGVPGPPGSQQLGSKDQMVPFAASQVVPQSQSQSQSQLLAAQITGLLASEKEATRSLTSMLAGSLLRG